jgi:hypothetical protein
MYNASRVFVCRSLHTDLWDCNGPAHYVFIAVITVLMVAYVVILMIGTTH